MQGAYMCKYFLFTIIFIVILFMCYGVACFPNKESCPYCKQESSYYVIESYGNYIYGWDSKFQLIFWLSTDQDTFGTCIHCGYSGLMCGFDSAYIEH